MQLKTIINNAGKKRDNTESYLTEQNLKNEAGNEKRSGQQDYRGYIHELGI